MTMRHDELEQQLTLNVKCNASECRRPGVFRAVLRCVGGDHIFNVALCHMHGTAMHKLYRRNKCKLLCAQHHEVNLLMFDRL